MTHHDITKLKSLKAKLNEFFHNFRDDPAKLPAEKVLQSILVITNIIVRENEYLREQKLDEATDLYNVKGEAIEFMSHLSTHAQEYGVSGDEEELKSIKDAEHIFNHVLSENRTLLKGALDAQTEVMKILIEGAVEDSQHGYDQNGNAGVDSTRTTLSLDSRA